MEEPSDKLYVQYRGLIKSMIRSIVINNPSVVDTQDLYQAGSLALVIALKSYDPSLGSFKSYIRKCIRNALLNEANSFNQVFTVDEKVRRQANSVIKMRDAGMGDDEIMNQLGIKTNTTFLSLLHLATQQPVDVNGIEVYDRDNYNIFLILNEIGLSPQELEIVRLIIDDYSIEDILSKEQISRSGFYNIKASIRNKIMQWGKN